MKIGSVCSGYEGLGMAVQSVMGGELAWVADNDQGASAILAHRFPSVPNLGDITVTDWAAVEPVDVFCAGFPCQDLSYAGHGAGIVEGNRSGLWYVIADALGVLRPRFVVLENVAAIVGRRPGLDVVLSDLARLGFDAEWVCVRASDVGAPHQRERWFAVAYPAASDERRRRSGGRPARPAGRPEPHDGCFAAADPDRAASGQWRLAASGQAEGRGARTDTGGRGGAPAADAECDARAQDVADGAAAARDSGALADANGGGRGAEPRPGRRGRRERVRAAEHGPGDIQWGLYAGAIRRWEAILGRPAPRPTEPGRTGERLSPPFVEWMQGLPSGWVTTVPGLSRNDQLKALGNGVVPQQAAKALRLLGKRAGIQSAEAAA